MTGVFENFRKICLKMYHLNPIKFLSCPGLAWQAALKKAEVIRFLKKLDLLTDIDMLLTVEKGKYVTQFIDMQKVIINIWKTMIKIKNLQILNIEM